MATPFDMQVIKFYSGRGAPPLPPGSAHGVWLLLYRLAHKPQDGVPFHIRRTKVVFNNFRFGTIHAKLKSIVQNALMITFWVLMFVPVYAIDRLRLD